LIWNLKLRVGEHLISKKKLLKILSKFFLDGVRKSTKVFIQYLYGFIFLLSEFEVFIMFKKKFYVLSFNFIKRTLETSSKHLCHFLRFYSISRSVIKICFVV